MPIDLTPMLKEWGVTLGLLSVTATALIVLLVLSLREFSIWFLRVGKILDQQRAILDGLNDVKAKMNDLHTERKIVQHQNVQAHASPDLQFKISDAGISGESTPAKSFQIHS